VKTKRIARQTVTFHHYNTIIVGAGAAGMNSAGSQNQTNRENRATGLFSSCQVDKFHILPLREEILPRRCVCCNSHSAARDRSPIAMQNAGPGSVTVKGTAHDHAPQWPASLPRIFRCPAQPPPPRSRVFSAPCQAAGPDRAAGGDGSRCLRSRTADAEPAICREPAGIGSATVYRPWRPVGRTDCRRNQSPPVQPRRPVERRRDWQYPPAS